MVSMCCWCAAFSSVVNSIELLKPWVKAVGRTVTARAIAIMMAFIALCIVRLSRFFPGTQLREHLLFRAAERPRRTELEVRFILNRSPVTAPLKAQVNADCADGLI